MIWLILGRKDGERDYLPGFAETDQMCYATSGQFFAGKTDRVTAIVQQFRPVCVPFDFEAIALPSYTTRSSQRAHLLVVGSVFCGDRPTS